MIITYEILSDIAGHKSPLMPKLADWMNKICPKYEIDTAQEYAHFIAQACHETDHFRTLREYASGSSYEGRKDLGNVQKGDGVKFKGRGIFQTTGRANYTQLGSILGKPHLFTSNPELLEQPEYAVWSACEFWKTRNLNNIANCEDNETIKRKIRGKVYNLSPVAYISSIINGGFNGLDQRKAFYAKAKNILKDEPELEPVSDTSGILLLDRFFDTISNLSKDSE